MSVPVGKVEVLNIYPVTFKEFLSTSDPKIYDYIEHLSTVSPLPEIVLNRLEEEYRRYLVCGGMPEAVKALLENKGLQAVDNILQNILGMYSLDFSKYASPTNIPRIDSIWSSLPSQLAKENRKFIYSVVKKGARARDYEDALLWLKEAGLIYQVYNISKPGLPLSAYRDLSAFKLYACDCGLLRRLANLSPEAILSSAVGYTEFKGSIAENAVLQSLIPQSDAIPYYWCSGNKAEVDFILQMPTSAIPVEVKADKRISGKSLSIYANKFNPPIRIRYSMNNLKKNGGLISIPLPLADWTYKLIKFM